MTVLRNRYTQDSVIGVGGMGTVYLGTDITTEERVALKRLHKERIALQPELVERFVREADALRQLNHPNIVKAFAHFEEDGDQYIVMEYVAGKDLSDLLIHQGKLPLKQAVRIALGITDALTRAHYLRITHRDLKPANVLLEPDGTPRLTDFGVAYWEARTRVTGAGIQIGTPAYMSPEVINGGSGDPRSDLWALGVMLYEMVAGTHPFWDGSMNQLLVNVLIRPTPDIQQLRPDCPDALADLIYRALEKDPLARISSARLVGAELEIIDQILDDHTVQPIAIGESRFALETAPPVDVKHNLPVQSTPIVGRDEDVRTLRHLLETQDVRLITLVGPGGMGKTRLALATAHAIIGDHASTIPLLFEHGIHLIELAPLLSSEPLVPTIANALGFQFSADGDPKQQLLDYLREKKLLLIADNFEHILNGAPLMAEILVAAPGVKILATSRERLSLMAETVYALDGLDVPPDDNDLDALKNCAAVRLFVQSAQRTEPSWKVTPDEYPVIADICRQMEGLPLGIVLAAAWVQTLSVREIIGELGRSIDILESDLRDMPTRHRSLRAVFDYSWQTMLDDERSLVMKLSVFRGGLSRRAGQIVADASLRQLAALVNKSLLRRNPDHGSYHMHELLRHYAEVKLVASGTAEAVRAAHSDYYLDTLAEVQRSLEGGAQIDTLHNIDSDIENVRAAWVFGAATGSLGKLERALPTMSLYFEMRGQYAEGLAYYEQVIATLRGRSFTTGRDAVLGHVLARAAALATTLHLSETVDAMLAESRGLLAAVQGPARAALAFAQGFDHLTLRHVADGRPYFEQAAALYRAAGERWALARTLGEWASTFWYRADGGSSDFDKARALAEEALAIQRALGDTYGMATTLLHLGTIASYAGDDVGDAQCTAESLALFQRVGHLYGMAHALNNIGVREMMIGEYVASRQHLEKSLQIKREIGTVIPIVWSHFVLARLSFNEAKFEESLHQADDGLALVIGSVHKEWELTLRLARAQALMALGRYGDAIVEFNRSLEIAAELGNAEDEAFALSRKGLALILSEDLEAAGSCLELAITRAGEINDVTTIAVSRILLAWAALLKGDAETARTLHTPAAAYFADKENWVISYTNDEWQLNTWAIESALIAAEIAFRTGDSGAGALLAGAVDAAERAFSPAHICKAVAFAASLLADTHPELAARLASAVVLDPQAYCNDRVSAQAVLTRLGAPDEPFSSVEVASLAARQALL
ncbi:MAG: protein kinase [Chloroflexi bacterium]|nr:protein kinase [Chloroflexota bacterium]